MSDAPQRYTAQAFDALSANVAILAEGGEILAVNAAWRAFAQENAGGQPVSDGVGSDYLAVCDATQGEDREVAVQTAAGIRAVLAGQQPRFELEYPCQTVRGQMHFVVRVTCFVQDGARYAVVAHEDITRRKLAELEVRQLNRSLEARVAERTREAEAARAELQRKNDELERSNQELAQFAAVASHDLQEPLRTLSAYADLLRHRYQDQLDARALGYLRTITEQVARARQLVRDVLTVSQVSDGAPLDRLDLGAVWAQEVAALTWPAGAEYHADPLPPVQADGAQVRQLLQNLLGNAVKFRADRPLRVSLSGRRLADPWQGDWVEFALRDNGLGIAEEHREGVFIMFRRLHGRTPTGGNGIGLAVCKKVVERHGGRIWLDSREGEGTTVYFTLPAAGSTPSGP